MKSFFKGLFLLMMTLSCDSATAPPPSKKEMLFRQLSDEFIALMKKDEQMLVEGRGGGLSGGEKRDKISEFFFSFLCPKLVNLEQARSVAIRCAEKFLEMVNSNDEIRPFLEHYPYRPSGLEFVIEFYPYEEGKPFTANKYVYLLFFATDGTIDYAQNSPKPISENVILTETYEEAQERNKAAL